jgi:hypothetical protein
MFRRGILNRMLSVLAFTALFGVYNASAQLNDSCTISVLNRNITAQPDGTWVIPNIPANQGRVRARATCVQSGATIFGQSDLFLVPSNGAVNVMPIQFGTVSPIPDSLTMSSGSGSVKVGSTLQLTTTAVYPGGATANVTAAGAGTDYSSSSPSVASVSPNGLVTGLSQGAALITAFNEGTQGFSFVRVGGGIPAVTISSPASGASVIEGATLPVIVQVTGGPIAAVTLLANGEAVSSLSTSPYQFSYSVPLVAGSIVLTAAVTDEFGEVEVSAPVTIVTSIDPLTTAIGSVVNSSGNPVSGARVVCQGVSGSTLSNGSFSIAGVPTAQNSVVCIATFTSSTGLIESGNSIAVAPVRAGTTDMGRIVLGSLNSHGTDFWMAFQNFPNGKGALLTVLSETTAHFTVSAPGFSTSGTSSPTSPQTVTLPDTLQITSNQSVESKGIHLTSDAEISATFFYSQDGTHDAYLSIPTSSLGKEYYAASYVGGSAQFAVTAALNNTSIAITPACKSVAGTPAGAPFNVLLNQGQTYQYECDTDVTGSHIVSDQPVSVVSGNGCTFIPAGSTSCAVTTEMMFPVSTLYGTDFYAVAFLDTAVRIVAARDGTSVTVDDGFTVTTYSLAAGKFKELRGGNLTTLAAFHISSNNPVSVLQFGGQISTEGQTFGGPSSIQLLPTPAFKTQQSLLPVTTGALVNFAIMVVPNSAVSTIELNGAPYPASFLPLPGGKYQWAFVFPAIATVATFTANAPIALYSTGFGIPPSGSFAFPVSF